MGIADRHIEYRENFRKRKFTLGQPGNALIAITTINVIFFLLLLVTRVFYLYTHQGQGMQALNFDAIEWFALPGRLSLLSERPWTLLTFMFSHGGQPPITLLITMLSNMFWLYAFGYILQHLSGNKLIFPVYIYGSLAGAVFFIAAVYLIPSVVSSKDLPMLAGASSGVTALAITVTAIAPKYRLFRNIGKGVPVWILTSLFLLFNMISAAGFMNASSFAIIGGGLAGFLFIYFLRRGKDGSIWMNKLFDGAINIFNPVKKPARPYVKDKIFYNAGSRNPYNKINNISQQRIDEILDKINQKGYHFLTDEEKNILKRAGEE